MNALATEIFSKDNMSENSYIVIEGDVVYLQCRECYKENQLGSFWPASNGYGPNVKCKCGRVIHENCDEKGQAEAGIQNPRR